MTTPTGLLRPSLPEHEVLRCCARVSLDADDRDRLRRALPLVRSWERLRRLASHHELTPLVYRHLGGELRAWCPPALLEGWHAACRTILTHTQRLTAELLAIVRLLRAERLPFRAYKGPVAAVSWYGDIGLRSFSDLDLLIRAEDLAAATGLLARRQFRPHRIVPAGRLENQFRTRGELAFERDDPPAVVDLHSHLIPPGYSFSPAPQDCWFGEEQVALGGATVPTLAPETALIFLCLHGAKHGWSSLKWLVDLAQALRKRPAPDWDRVLRWALRPGRRRIVGLGLRLAAWLLEAPVPADVLAPLAREPRVDRLAELVARRLFPLRDAAPPPASLPWQQVYFQLMSLGRDRWWHLAYRLLLPTAWEWRLLSLPGPLYPLYYLVRPLRLLARAAAGKSGQGG
jgi:hypothetical protein